MTQPWGQRPTRRCHRISPHRLIIWRGAKPLLCKDAPHAGQGGQAVGRRARSARTASTRWTARTRAACHAARISAGSEGASSTARSRRCISRSSSRMLSCRHSSGHRPPLETLVRGSKSVPHFRCYASPPPTKTCARYMSKLRLFLREREPHVFEECFEYLFHGLGFCLCSVTQHYEIIGVADVEEIAFSLFSSPSPLGFGEFQGLGFHILVHCIEVYVGQEGAHDATLGCSGQGFFKLSPVHHPGTQEFPE